MRVLIVGYGRMGHEVEAVLERRGHEITGRYDTAAGVGDLDKLDESVLNKSDAAIEFSLAEGAVENAKAYAASGTAAVVGTTGWTDRMEEVKELFQEKRGAYLHGANFSIGAHIFLALSETAARLVNEISDYDAMAMEIHHKNKKDSPSGTAMALGRRVLEQLDRKTKLVTETLHRPPEPEEFHIASLRGGAVPGTHRLLLDSPADSVEVSHIARGRAGFALGAVLAAEWLQGKTGFYTVDEFISDFLK
ncbi:MAG: 4-hydroxy-tetrahydrodipicolinate reductase [Spirochaetales bacterium]|nr:4-hydroxy-tetrahydrodipicolinate reductase [Spirochaetales bacterium]MCF7937100.1 4-hydroxy-tetrahydrodipicolinate reductase [Spirochaetales bacterium]